MLNIYEFINSRDIKEYCKKIGHNFNLLESAYLIYKSVSHTLPEKHAAWKELIEIMPDVVVGEEIFRPYYDINYRFFRPVEPELEDTEYPHYDSLHEFLCQYMALQDRLLDRFFRDEPDCAYQYDVLILPYRDESGNDIYYGEPVICPRIFKSFADVLADGYRELASDHPMYLQVRKQKIIEGISEKPWEICIIVDQNGEPLEISYASNIISVKEEKLFTSFGKMWMNIPTPFKKGDILVDKVLEPEPGEPFVLDHLCTDKTEENSEENNEQNFCYLKCLGHMPAYGYTVDFVDPEGHLNGFLCGDYLNMEYYDGELTQDKRILRVISAFLRKEIDLCECMAAYHYITLEEALERWKSKELW